VAAIRGRSAVSIGIPYRSASFANDEDWRSGVKPLSTYSSGREARPIIRSRHPIWSP
jgi:hypothetical protein